MEKEETLSAQIAKKKMKEGGLLPSFLAVWLWSGALIGGVNENNHIIMDGAPRTLLEAMMTDDAMKFYGRDKVIPVFLETSEEWSIQRLLGRGKGRRQFKVGQRKNGVF